MSATPRTARAKIGDLQVETLAVRFRVEKSLGRDPNALDLEIRNLSPASRAGTQRAWIPVSLVAGTGEVSELVFSGEARSVSHDRDGADWITRVRAGDGERQLGTARSAVSFGPNARFEDVVRRLASELGVSSGNAMSRLARGDFNPAVRVFLQGFSASGPTARELDRVIGASGLTWSIQDGNLQIAAPGQAVDPNAIVLRPTDLLATPEYTAVPGQPGTLRARSVLQPGLRPGRAVRFESRSLPGTFVVTRVVHAGDTVGAEWSSELEAVEARR